MKSDMIAFILLLFVVSVHLHTSEEYKCDLNNINEIANWANNLSALKLQDERRTKVLRDHLSNIWPNDQAIRQAFYEFLSQPLQTVCSIPKKIGGNWIQNCGWFDGEKHVCMDNLKYAVDHNKCLVYSFGLGSDWEFELAMADLGCTVRAFDPTITQVPKDVDLRSNIHFVSLGLGSYTGKSVVHFVIL